MEQTGGSASAFKHGMARGQDGAGDLLIVLAKMMGMLLRLIVCVPGLTRTTLPPGPCRSQPDLAHRE